MQGDHDERDLQLDAPDQDVRLGGTLRQARRGPQVHGVYVRMNWISGNLSRYSAFTQFVSAAGYQTQCLVGYSVSVWMLARYSA